jgi:cellulose synthase/poly-beta-1,6-N-acetylglucosamine synthase-like glycosyltransferase
MLIDKSAPGRPDMDANQGHCSVEEPILSVVVIGRNEGKRLSACLQSVMAIGVAVKAFEVIYVDSSSSDDSVERAGRFKATVIQVHPDRPCAAVGRNAGWRVARAAIVLFLDGDTILAPDFVGYAIQQFADPNIAVVFGDRREVDTDTSIYNRVLDLDWIPPRGAIELCGGDALIRREVLERVNGYDERLIAGEDAELCSRIRALGWKVIHLDRRMVGHDLAIHRFSQYWRRSVRTGYAYAEVSERFRNSALPVWSREAHSNRVRGGATLAMLAGSLVLSLAARSILPITTVVLIIAGLAVRTAIRSQWKCADLKTRLLYGFHSHLAQIPMLFGQLRYRYNRLRDQSAALIEYK